MASKERSDKQPLDVQLQKDKIPINTSLLRAYHEARFTECWEEKLLPEIVKILNNNTQGAYSINVRKGNGPDQRVIDLMTKDNCAKMYSELLEAAKKEHLPEEFRSKTHFDFRSGKRVYCADESGSETSLQAPDSAHFRPRNPHRFDEPVMGDSAGTTSTGNTATLGPLLEVNKRLYRLVNWHLFDDEVGNRNHNWDKRKPPAELELVHPSPSDLAQYSAGDSLVKIGKVVAYSGPMYKTNRAIASSGPLGSPAKETWQTTTDWALCETHEDGNPNKVRHILDGEETGETSCFFQDITETTSTMTKGDRVYATGRSSGYTEGELCMPSYLKNDDETVQRDWAVSSYAREDAAWEEGMGIFGDSGAGIMDRSNRLIGQLWGRNHYDDDPKEPAITYFTRITDIFDDIQERWPGDYRCSRPKLPGEVLHTNGTDGTALAITEILNSVSTTEGSTDSLSNERHLDVVTEVRRSSARSALMVTGNGNKAKHFWIHHAATWPELQA
ncbi:DNA polymerase epsilon subunit 1 [Apiospora marii]|uniref:DNA polymerase epsilon subunit 1 n=1 Tax=Apiospora marii TaxID=335849 RepID=A0ABR1RHM5_9PEZI